VWITIFGSGATEFVSAARRQFRIIALPNFLTSGRKASPGFSAARHAVMKFISLSSDVPQLPPSQHKMRTLEPKRACAHVLLRVKVTL
jgi:hypothetical protein